MWIKRCNLTARFLLLILLALSCGSDSKKTTPIGPDDSGSSSTITINGKLAGTDGESVSGASVAFADTSSKEVAFLSTTDENGEYEIEISNSVNLTTTKFTLTIECNGYIPYILNDVAIISVNKYDYIIPRESDPIKIALVHDADNPVACIIANDEGSSLQIVADKNADGSISKIIGSLYVVDDGTSITVMFGNDGLPSTVLVGEWIFKFSNYSNTTVDLSMISPDGELYHHESLQVDTEKLALLKQEISEGDFATSLGIITGASKTAHWFFNDPVEGAIKGLALGTSLAGCLAASGATVLSAGAAVPVAVLACGSTFLSAVSLVDWAANGDGIFGKVGEGQGVAIASFALNTDIIDYVGIGNVALSGFGVLAEAGSLVYENAREKYENNKIYTLLGRIVEGDNGLAGIAVQITGSNFDETIYTNSFGAFSLSTLKNGSYTVKPIDERYEYTPSYIDFTINDDDYAIQRNITAILKRFTISGTVLSGGSGLSGVTVTMGDRTATTGNDGSYRFTDVAVGSYTLAFTKSSYVFTPSTKNVTVSRADVTVDTVTAVQYIEGVAPDLLSYELSPASPSVRPGESFTARFQITNPNSAAMPVNLDVRWRSSSDAYGEFDPTTYSATIAPGTAWYERPCTVPDGMTAGIYSVGWYVLDTNNRVIKESGYRDNSLTVLSSSGGTPGGTTTYRDITFVTIPAVTTPYVMSSGYSVTLSSYEMSVTEVTNAQYAAYLNAALTTGDITVSGNDVLGKGGVYSGQRYLDMYYSYNSNNKCWISYSSGTFVISSGKENWPVVNVTWYGSKAFALYYGLDLPTEAEWQYAASGGRNYEYGTADGTISTSTVNYWDTGIKHPVNVGSYPANPFGLRDMSGNVWEWCADWYGNYPSGTINNPTGAQTGSSRVKRGGCWHGYATTCRAAGRRSGDPGGRGDGMGFRVVRR